MADLRYHWKDTIAQMHMLGTILSSSTQHSLDMCIVQASGLTDEPLPSQQQEHPLALVSTLPELSFPACHTSQALYLPEIWATPSICTANSFFSLMAFFLKFSLYMNYIKQSKKLSNANSELFVYYLWQYLKFTFHTEYFEANSTY